MKKIVLRFFAYIFGIMQSAYYKQKHENIRKNYDIKNNFRFNGQDIRIYGKGEFVVGQNSYIGNYSTIQLTEGCKVVIGNGCHISHNVRMYTSSLIADQDFTGPNNKKVKCGSIIIGDGVWIGANVFINPGIKIGKNSIIGANSVLTKDVEECAIMGGVPAKLIRYKKI